MGWTSLGPVIVSGGQVENIIEESGNTSAASTLSGAIECAWCDQDDANTIVIGAVGGGIWKTTNAKSGDDIIWVQKSLNISDNRTFAITGIAQNFVVYQGGSYVSNDIVAITGASSAIGYGSDINGGILISSDKGDTWTQEYIVVGGVTKKLDLNAVVYFGGFIAVASHRFGRFESSNSDFGDGGVFFRALDGTWSHLNVPSNSEKANFPCMSLSVTGAYAGEVKYNLMVSILGKGIYISNLDNFSDPSTSTWTNTTSSTSFLNDSITAVVDSNFTNNNMLLSSCRSDKDVVYTIVVNTGQVSKIGYTTNFGDTWSEMTQPITINTSDSSIQYLHPTTNRDGTPKISGKAGSQGAIHLSLYAHPTNSSIVFAGGDRQPETGGSTLMGATTWTARLFRGDRTSYSNTYTTGGYSNQWAHITHSNANTFTMDGFNNPVYGALRYGGTSNVSAPHADSRWMELDADGNLIECNDGGIYKLTSPTHIATSINDTSSGKWYSLIGNLNVFEVHNFAYDHNNDRVICSTQDCGSILTSDITISPISALVVSQGDGGVAAVYHVNSNDTYIYSSSQYAGNLFRRKYSSVSSTGDTESITWCSGNAAFVPQMAVNGYNGKYVIEITGAATNGIYMSDPSVSLENNSLIVNIGNYGSTSITHMIYGHSSNNDILYFLNDYKLFSYNTSNSTLVEILNITTTNSLSPPTNSLSNFKSFAIHQTDNTKIAIVTGYLYQAFYNNYLEEFSTNQDDNQLILYDNGTTTVIDIPYNRTISCAYIDEFIFIGHSQGVCCYNNNNGFHPVNVASLPNVAVNKMIYDSTDSLLLVSTTGKGVYSIPKSDLITGNSLTSNISGDPHVTTLNNISYKLELYGNIRLFSNNHPDSHKRITINALSEPGPGRWKCNDYFTKIFIQQCDKYILIDLGFRGKPVSVLESNGIDYSNTYMKFHKEAKLYCFENHERFLSVQKAKKYVEETGYNVPELVRNQISLIIRDCDGNKLLFLVLCNVNEYNLQPCRIHLMPLKQIDDATGCCIDRKYTSYCQLNDIKDDSILIENNKDTDHYSKLEKCPAILNECWK